MRARGWIRQRGQGGGERERRAALDLVRPRSVAEVGCRIRYPGMMLSCEM